jgi:hypothetical protein
VIDLLRRGALLWGEDASRASRTGEQAGYICRDYELHAGGGWQAVPVDTDEVREGCAAAREVAAGTIEEAGAEGPRHARAAVGSCAASDSDGDLPRAQIERASNELTDTKGICVEWIETGGQEAGEAVGLGRFDGYRAALVEDQEFGISGTTDGILDGDGDTARGDGGGKRIDEAGAAVGEGEEVDLGAGECAAAATGDCLGRRCGGECALELLRSHEDAHAG